MRIFHTNLDGLKKSKWNQRPLDEDEFFRMCKRFKVRISFYPLSVNGFYYRCKGVDHIAIESRIKGKRRLFTMFHELGHFLLHAPENGVTANFSGLIKNTREEKEADAFALSCLFPLRYLLEKSYVELIEEEGYPSRLIARRRKIYERYGI